ncbi:MAG: 4-hydroxy-tetrahydrodipicolinate synthase [Acidobacteria bacterium]|nr:4-hydroxy-tetrahydrodipicolinate synthase [Acidobacteriota bacterium]
MRTLADILGRVAVPLVTPFRANEDVHWEALGELADFVIRKGYCDSLILTGTTGEFYALTDEERIGIWETAKEAVAGRAPLVAGVGSASTRNTVRLAQAAERLGYDVIMVVLPYYSRPTQEGLLRHFRSVSEAVSLPILVYNIPLFTGVNMEPETLARLAEIPTIRGIKEEAGIQPTQATAYALRTPPDFSIYCGDDTMVLQVLPQRGVGVVSGGSQVVGNWIKDMIAAYFHGDNAGASEIYFQLAPFFAALNQNGRINPIPILRGAIELVSGIPIGPPRSPQAAASEDELSVIQVVLDSLVGSASAVR